MLLVHIALQKKQNDLAYMRAQEKGDIIVLIESLLYYHQQTNTHRDEQTTDGDDFLLSSDDIVVLAISTAKVWNHSATKDWNMMKTMRLNQHTAVDRILTAAKIGGIVLVQNGGSGSYKG